MVEPDNLILEYLRGIRTDLGKMADWMQTLSVEMTAIRQHLAGVVTRSTITPISPPSSSASIASRSAWNWRTKLRTE
jgi:hypothetical protein